MNLEIVHEALGRSRLAGLNDTDVMVYVIDNLSVDTTRKPLPPSASSPPASLTQPPTFASTPSSSPVAALPYLALGVGPTTTPSTPSRENGVKEYDVILNYEDEFMLIRQVCEVLIFTLPLSQSSGLASHPLSATLLG
ncbi:hypothetical protein GmHk_07G019795 [Glycine max]|nr:hypothetical protein GmHk_07G019795 [Glycine max]